MPLMLSTNSYDTVYHEHLEHYFLLQMVWMPERVGFKIVGVGMNDVNGGSVSVMAQKFSGHLIASPTVLEMVDFERDQRLHDLQTYFNFAERARESKRIFLKLLKEEKLLGKKVVTFDASMKGNVFLQRCRDRSSLVSSTGEVNPDRLGVFTPGAHIPNLNEKEVIASSSDYVLVLPWHFKEYFESQSRYVGLKLLYPLPKLSFD